MKKNKYIVVKEFYGVDECTHSLCHKFHTNGCPEIIRSEWIIIDTETGERGNLEYSNSYDLKRDAINAIKKLERIEQ